ncbi:MAG: hypothetical protein JW828_12355 [Sedimentisphaerales bacterium]|nr:hypothetical protein [Sedimentisphaerales bacterium]
MGCKTVIIKSSVLFLFLSIRSPVLEAEDTLESPAKTVLAIDGSRFTLHDRPVFLLGFSYYGGLGASESFIRADLDDFQRYGFNWLRLWATWNAYGNDVSAVDDKGRSREPYLSRLKWLLAECDRRGMVVDVTLTRGKALETGGSLPNFASHKQAVQTLVEALRPYRNWYLDLANERDIRDDRYVGCEELKELRELVRRLDPQRLVTASFGGHDLSEQDLHDVLVTIGVDFVSPHRPRHAESPDQTEEKTTEVLERMKNMGRIAPLHYQEPFRRGYGTWVPKAEDFLQDLRGAIAGGAAGWCFHNGGQRTEADERPRRSFDLHEKRLFEQLDEVELQMLSGISNFLGARKKTL